jgi:hypothetical protein
MPAIAYLMACAALYFALRAWRELDKLRERVRILEEALTDVRGGQP